MKIFEKILLGFLILVFIVSLLSSIFYGTFSFYSFLDALTNTLLWGIPCLFIWVIVKMFIHFTKKVEKTENIKKTEKVKKTGNINKKIITLVFIFLIIINTIFWLNLTIKTFAGTEDYLEKEMGKRGYSLRGRINWSRVVKKTPKMTDEEYALTKALEIALIENTPTYKMIKTFEGSESMLITFLIITNAVLIAIYFMMSPLYKKESKSKR